MANFTLSELSSITAPASASLIYLVQDGLSQNSSIDTLFNNVPNGINLTSGEYLSGGQPIADLLETKFITRELPVQWIDIIDPIDPYIVTSNDGGHIISIASSTASVVTLSAGIIDTGFSCKVIQSGTSPITFTAGPGVTIQSLNSLSATGGEFAEVTVYKATAIDTFILTGDLA